ncbi:hypothetical protein RSAG8_07632, partial [Rhizoctonia solani AG-8 WAC10335]
MVRSVIEIWTSYNLNHLAGCLAWNFEVCWKARYRTNHELYDNPDKEGVKEGVYPATSGANGMLVGFI